MNNFNNAGWWIRQGNTLNELEDRVYFISEIILTNFGKIHKLYKLFYHLIENLGTVRSILDITIIDYFPDQKDYVGNIRNLFMFMGNPRCIDRYQKTVYPSFPHHNQNLTKGTFILEEYNFIVKFLNELRGYVNFIKNCQVIFAMPRERFEKINANLNKINNNIDKVYEIIQVTRII